MKPKAIRAIYEKGFLKLKEPLPLEENQEVLLLLIPLKSAYRHNRLAVMRERVEQWLAAQPEDTVRPPVISDRPDPELEQLIAAIRREASHYSLEEIAADIEAALAEVKGLSPEERAMVEKEIDEWIAELDITEE